MPSTLRERFGKKFLNQDPYDSRTILNKRYENGYIGVMMTDIVEFLESEIALARQQMKEECLAVIQ